MAISIPDEDSLLTLAFSIHSNPGAYALLLGAGVSAPSGIPTAWGVLADLTRQMAAVGGSEPQDSIEWYESTFHESARYESVLKRLAPSSIERQRLLKRYFEPSLVEDRAESAGPTAAHKAIARLVKAGSVRIILTLNFDRLMEQALQAEGIEPVVVSTPSDVQGLAPLHTLQCCVVHLHGDYLNPTSMLNTEEELSGYDQATTRLLQHVLEEYGLVVAGWSAVYDPALRSAIASHYSTRLTMAWIEPGVLPPLATDLASLKRALVIPTYADAGFGKLSDAVLSLGSRAARHPLTVSVAVDTAKRELSGKAVSIGLHDTLAVELARLRDHSDFHLPSYQSDEEYGGYAAMVERVLEATRVPAGLISTLAYWGNSDTDSWWIDELERFAKPSRGGGSTRLLNLRLISGSMLFYSAGIAAVAGRRYQLLSRLLSKSRPHPYRPYSEPLADVLSVDAAGWDPASTLRPILSSILAAADEPLDAAWQQFESVRSAWLLAKNDRYLERLADFVGTTAELENAKNSYRSAEAANDGVEAAGAVRAEAWQSREKSMGRLVDMVAVGRPHILVEDVRGDEGYRSAVATRLSLELEGEGDAHPLVAESDGMSAGHLATAAYAVSIAFGRAGKELAWSRVRGQVGIVPSEIWLDSGLTPEETEIATRQSAGL